MQVGDDDFEAVDGAEEDLENAQANNDAERNNSILRAAKSGLLPKDKPLQSWEQFLVP